MKKRSASDTYDWKYCSIGGVTRVAITTGEDIAHLPELDRKLWTVLSLPVSDLQFDAATLAVLDTDADGKIRVDQIKEAAKWLTDVLRDMDKVIEGGSSVELASLRDDTEAGKAVLEAAKIVLQDTNAEASCVTIADLDSCRLAFEAKCKAAAEVAAAEAAAQACPYGDATDSIIASSQVLRPKVADFFMRCKLIGFDAECASNVDVPVAKIGEISADNLAENSSRIAELPIARPGVEGILPVGSGINPAWQSVFGDMRPAIEADYPGAEGIDESQWNAILAKLDNYVGLRNSCITAGSDLLDAEGAAKKAAIELTSKLLLLCRDFYTLLRNFVIFYDFYSADTLSIFDAGKLYLDQRCCKLCIKVSDMGKHGDMAGLSGMFLIYCTCTSKTKGGTINIVAVLTKGEVAGLRVGKNGVFYDRNGEGWDAVITKIVDNPISIRQAFWSPYRKFATWCADKIDKAASDSESKSTSKLVTAAESAGDKASEDMAAGNAKVQAPAFDIAKFAGIFAAIGMALGLIGSFLLDLFKGFVGLGKWIPVAVLGIILVISGPSMFIAWRKLRRRDLGPVLNANGWAINARVLVNSKFGSTLTDIAKYPSLKLDDPYSERTPFWKKLLWALVIIIAAACLTFFLLK